MTKVSISLFVPCKNEEANLARCLQSVHWVDEIFVVDSQSTDRTCLIAEELGVKVVQFEYKGRLAQEKKLGIRKPALFLINGS
jgi:glycosyltransferase involved in cell wall biosynthesis